LTTSKPAMPTIGNMMTLAGSLPEPEPDCWVVFSAEHYPASIAPGEDYIAPAIDLHRDAGDQMQVLLWAAPPRHHLQWRQFVHIDDILFTNPFSKEQTNGTTSA
jgi:hypothetical protein